MFFRKSFLLFLPVVAVSAQGNLLPSYLVGTQTGDATFFATGLGDCGIVNNDGQHIAFVSHLVYDTFPGFNGTNVNPVCSLSLTLTFQGRSVQVAVTGRCVACAVTDLNLSPSAFEAVADPALGRIQGVTWTWDNLPPNL